MAILFLVLAFVCILVSAFPRKFLLQVNFFNLGWAFVILYLLTPLLHTVKF
jgi:hypothetical protein